MAEEKVDILLSVDLSASETLKQIAQLRDETSKLKGEQKELDKTTEEGRVEFERYNAQIKANTGTIRQLEKEVQNSIKQDAQKSGSIKALRAELSNAKNAYAELSAEEREAAGGRELLERTAALNEQLKELEAAYGDNQRDVGNYAKASAGLSKELEGVEAQLQALASEGKKGTAAYESLELRASELTGELKELRQAYIDGKLASDNFEDAQQGLTAELGEAEDRLYELALQGQQNSDVYKELFDRVVLLKNTQIDVDRSVDALVDGQTAATGYIQAVEGVVAAYAVWQAGAQALGIENEELEATMQKIVLVMGALQSLQKIQEVLNKRSVATAAARNILQKIGLTQTNQETIATLASTTAKKAEALSENAGIIAKTKAIVATKAVTAAQWLWNAAMSANPVVLLVTALLALTAGVVALVGWLNKESEAALAAAEAQRVYAESAREAEREQSRLTEQTQRGITEREIALGKELTTLRKNGASKAEIYKAEFEARQQILELEAVAAADSQKIAKQQRADAVALQLAQLAARDELKKGTKAWREYNDAARETGEAIKTLNDVVFDAYTTEQKAFTELVDNEAKMAKELEAVRAEEADKAKQRVADAVNRLNTQIEAQRKFAEESIKSERGALDQSVQVQATYARRLFDLNTEAEVAKLENLKKYRQLTEEEYSRSLSSINTRVAAFAQTQAATLNKFYESEREAVLGLLTATVDEQVKVVEEKYAEALQRLGEIQPPDPAGFATDEEYDKALAEYEVFAANQAATAIRLEQQREQEVAQVRRSALAQQAEVIRNATAETYADDLARASENERAKLAITERQLLDTQKAKRAAGLDTFEEEAQLEALRLQRAQLNLNTELLLAGDNAQARFDAKSAALNAELEAAQGNADAIIAINARVAENEAELFEARTQQAQMWAGATMQVLSDVNALSQAITERETEGLESTYEREAELLDKQLEKGLISQEKFDEQSVALEEKKNAEVAALQRQQAIRDRALGAFQIGIDTAQSIVASSKLGFPLAIPFVALAAATGAVQLAALLATPLPKAARGGIIGGQLHANGGTILEGERGEVVINRQSSSMFLPLLSAINEIGGGVPFAGPLSDGGFTARRVSGESTLTANEIADALREVKIYTASTDVKRGQDDLADIVDRGKF